MPENCAGPDGLIPCPNGPNAKTHLSNGDLMLCKDCNKSRFGVISRTVTNNLTDQSNVEGNMLMEQVIVNELLCFVTNKIDSLPFESITQLCMGSFEDMEIEQAKATLFSSCKEETKMRKRHGANKTKNNLVDILQFVKDRGENLPIFTARNLSKLPPISADNVEISMLLNSISSTKAELEQMKMLMKSRDQLVQTLADSAASMNHRVTTLEQTRKGNTENSYAAKLMTPIPQDKNIDIANQRKQNPIENVTFVPLQNTTTELRRPPHDKNKSIEVPSSNWETVQRKRKKPGVVGTSNTTTFKTVKKSVRPKFANVFATRFDPSTTVAELKAYLDVALDVDAKVEKIETKFDTYASFHITCECTEPIKFMDEKLWPEDIYVRWWREKKIQSEQNVG